MTNVLAFKLARGSVLLLQGVVYMRRISLQLELVFDLHVSSGRKL